MVHVSGCDFKFSAIPTSRWLPGLIAFVLLLVGGVKAEDAKAVVPPPGEGTPQDVPIRLDRISATSNGAIDINGLDDQRVDVDVAVLDTGVKLDHPDLNIFARTDCTGATWPEYKCTNASPDDGGDTENAAWHGTYSALRLAALDNRRGIVGVANGARVWAVDITNDPYTGGFDPPKGPIVFDYEAVVAGVKWVVAHADEIEVAYLVAPCAPDQKTPEPQPTCAGGPENVDLVEELEIAVEEAIDAGVVVVTPTGNWNMDISTLVPTRFDDVLVVSPMSDSDGKPGGEGPMACGVSDDTSGVGNWGSLVDVAAPGCAASEAGPLLAGAAAILASKEEFPTDDASDVAAIGEAIFGGSDCSKPNSETPNVGAGDCGWTDKSPDKIKEPVLDIGDKALFAPKYKSPYLPAGPNTEKPEMVRDPNTGQPCGELTIDWPDVSGGCVIEGLYAWDFDYRQSIPCASSYIEIGELHVASDGTFAAADIGAECKWTQSNNAVRCDVEPEENLFFFPEKEPKNEFNYPSWTGGFIRDKSSGTEYAYLSLCLEIVITNDDRKWADAILVKPHATEWEGLFQWDFVASRSGAAWYGGDGLSTSTWEYGTSPTFEWGS